VTTVIRQGGSQQLPGVALIFRTDFIPIPARFEIRMYRLTRLFREQPEPLTADAAELDDVAEDGVVLGRHRDAEMEVGIPVGRHLFSQVVLQPVPEAAVDDGTEGPERRYHGHGAVSASRLRQALEDVCTAEEPLAGVAVELAAMI